MAGFGDEFNMNWAPVAVPRFAFVAGEYRMMSFEMTLVERSRSLTTGSHLRGSTRLH
jgi:hypothetical protein